MSDFELYCKLRGEIAEAMAKQRDPGPSQRYEFMLDIIKAVEGTFDAVVIDRKDFDRLQPRLGTPPFPPVPKEETPRPPFQVGDLVILTDEVITREARNVRFKKGDVANVVEDRGSCVWLVYGPNKHYSAFVDASQIRLMGKQDPK
jgi:hypothetical protein